MLQNWICLFQVGKMMEDQSMRSFISRISDTTLGIKSCQGLKDEYEIIWKILKALIPPYR